MNSKSEDANFEGTLESIERIVAEIEGGDLPLDQIVGKLKDAMGKIARCQAILGDVEQQIETILNSSQKR